jgi:hypothetical protein
MSPSRTSASTLPGMPSVAASPILRPGVRGSSKRMAIPRPYNIAYHFRRTSPRFSSTMATPQSCEVKRGVPGGFASPKIRSRKVTDQQRHREHCRKNWVVRGWERPHPSGVSATATAVLVAPTHVLPETNASTVPVLTKYKDWPQSWPKGEQP